MGGNLGSSLLSFLAVLLLGSFPSVGLAVCGNQVIDFGEQCDEGANNGTPQSCCTASCTFRGPGTVCALGSECTSAAICDGSSSTCPPAIPLDGGTPCGDDTSNACTAPDSCDGLGSCLSNHEPAGTPAPDLCDDGDACTTAECDGSGGCMNRSEHIMSTGFETDEPSYVCPLTMVGLVRLDS